MFTLSQLFELEKKSGLNFVTDLTGANEFKAGTMHVVVVEKV
jgi:hypothetical protein